MTIFDKDIKCGPIGVFDSGYGGLTILREFINKLPMYDYIYLADNARTPYGTRSFEIVYEYTLQAVNKLFDMGCQLVILACNTASAKALRTIQQTDLINIDPSKRVLGVIRPSVEHVHQISKSRSVGILGTIGTIASNSYKMELDKISDNTLKVSQEACPMWVPLVENNELNNGGTDFFVNKNIETLLNRDKNIDTIILGCTHYPLLIQSIRKYVSKDINIIEQGPIVADRLIDYLKRHPEMEKRCTKKGIRTFFTTENPEIFNLRAEQFLQTKVASKHLTLQ